MATYNSAPGVKGAEKGEPDDDVYLKFEMDDFGYAKSWSLVKLTAEIGYKSTRFGMDADKTMDVSFEVPGPYHRRQEGNVNKTIKWASNDDMQPDSEWVTIKTSQEN